MRFLTIAASVALLFTSYGSTASTGLTARQTTSGVTYQDIYNYALQMTGGKEDFTASLVKNHVATSGVAWSDAYQNDIHLDADGNGVLTVPQQNTPALAKRSGSMTAYPYSGSCNSGYSYTWYNPSSGCYAYWSDGTELAINSVASSGLSGTLYFFSGGSCGGSGGTASVDTCVEMNGWGTLSLFLAL
jgi:hypothetical protein